MYKCSYIIDFLKKQYILSLCCVNNDNLWCANCFYKFNEKNMSLWLMTKLDTKHGLYISQNSNVSGTINNHEKNIFLIKGIQYKGFISILSGMTKKKALFDYYKRYPISRIFNSPIWSIRLDEIKMTDNTISFGRKILWYRNKI
ncbi:hypothetical protein CRV12_01840 [Candidatus Pantoea edessiphila]|uniref:Uncharacterized protein n=1 Tax=Candidatus Pantoea edessiphila TaxID=2044610 RepID=A0A2P5T014_9GAMM|nr:YhbP family protein [Candidatus Pantoea edessiphila]PPI87939.1 hypothetical protein CRV12_01840 [Candidatus Pantoea edessiphila]